ncbi:unknown protein [Microcystis aeruginosa NIES-843]|uniref:Uncharacterized protein n=1 Tax=Microcystis aeruginosa (strain NIES-843 / IAM M-2473) TaxID=449447 RepID=B0JVG6_MICAN|nr:unknown protein [Microcystis aeruginosa NIES-843]
MGAQTDRKCFWSGTRTRTRTNPDPRARSQSIKPPVKQNIAIISVQTYYESALDF